MSDDAMTKRAQDELTKFAAGLVNEIGTLNKRIDDLLHGQKARKTHKASGQLDALAAKLAIAVDALKEIAARSGRDTRDTTDDATIALAKLGKK